MFEVRNNIHLLIIMYVVICLAIWYAKPDIMFNNGEVKPHGLGKNKTLFSYQIVIIMIALIMFYIFEIIMAKKNNFL